MHRLSIAALVLITAPALAAEAPQEPPKLYTDLVRCRAMPDGEARLACFDAATAQLEQAMQNRDIVMMDRQQIRSTRRTLFGLQLPDIELFGGGDDDEAKQLETRLASVGRNGDGRWLLVLEDGARWQQIDDRLVAVAPGPGDPVVIRRASMGTYMMRIRGQPGIRVKRIS